MTLSFEQLAQVQQWIDEKKINRQCPLCPEKTTMVIGRLINIPSYELTAERRRQGGNVADYLPVVILECTYCAYTAMLNAIELGLVPKQAHSEI